MLKLRMPTVKTKRLILRPIQLDDDKDMFEYCCDDEVVKYLWFETHDSVEFSRYVIEKLYLNRSEIGMPDAYPIVLKASNKMIGTIDVNQFSLMMVVS